MIFTSDYKMSFFAHTYTHMIQFLIKEVASCAFFLPTKLKNGSLHSCINLEG